MVGNRNLHPKVYMTAAGNSTSSMSSAMPMSLATRSRIVTYNLVSEKTDYWLETVGATINLHPVISAFLATNTSMLNNFGDGSNIAEGDTFACERTWDKLSNIFHTFEKRSKTSLSDSIGELLSTINGTVGVSAGNQLSAFMAYASKAVTLSQVLQAAKDMHVLEAPQGIQASWITLMNLAQCEPSDLGVVADYVETFANEELQIIFARIYIRKNPTDHNNQRINEWLMKAARYAL